MKQKLRTLLTCLLFILSCNALPLTAHAAGASITLVANKSEVSSGSTVVIAVYVNGGGTALNAAETDITYPASQLEYDGINYSGSAFSIAAPNNGGGSGLVTIGNGTTSTVSSTALVATVTFRALVGSGSAAFGVAGSSSLVSASTNTAVPYSPIGTAIKFGTPVAAAATTPTAAAAPAVAAPVAPPKRTTPPVITNLKASNITPFSATISWTTDEAADSVVGFGLDTSYGLSTSSATATTSHSVALSSAFLLPESLLHYHVESTDSAGNVATSPDQTLSLPGMPVTIIVRGADGQPQSGVQVTLDDTTAATNSHGSVTIPASLGTTKVTTTYQGVTVVRSITVSKTAKPLPPYQLDLEKQPLNDWMVTSAGLLIFVLTLLGIDAMLFGSKFYARFMGLHRWHPTPVAASSNEAPPEDFRPSEFVGASEPDIDPKMTIAELLQEAPVATATKPVAIAVHDVSSAPQHHRRHGPAVHPHKTMRRRSHKA